MKFCVFVDFLLINNNVKQNFCVKHKIARALTKSSEFDDEVMKWCRKLIFGVRFGLAENRVFGVPPPKILIDTIWEPKWPKTPFLGV